jgi:hypothetical protein
LGADKCHRTEAQAQTATTAELACAGFGKKSIDKSGNRICDYSEHSKSSLIRCSGAARCSFLIDYFMLRRCHLIPHFRSHTCCLEATK